MVDQVQSVSTSIMVSVPIELKALIERQAATNGQTVSAYARSLFARELGFTLTSPGGRGRKYASEAERIAAQKARDAERKELIKQLLAEYKSKKK